MRRALAASCLLAVATAGCGRQPERPRLPAVAEAEPQAPGYHGEAPRDAPTRVGSTQPPGPPDACSLLPVAVVQGALGALAGPPYLYTDRDGVLRCRYEARDLRSIDVEFAADPAGLRDALPDRTAEDPRATATDPDPRVRRQGTLRLPDERTLRGDWDSAWLEGCCRVVAVRGATAVAIDVQGSRVTLDRAAILAERALAGARTPLAIDGRAGMAAARARDALRPTPVDACRLLDRDGVERVMAGRATLEDSTPTGCEYRVRTSGGAARRVRWTVTWRGGYRELRGVVESSRGGERLREVAPALAPGIPAALWEQLALGSGRALAVRRDVAVAVESDVLLGRSAGTLELAAALVNRIR